MKKGRKKPVKKGKTPKETRAWGFHYGPTRGSHSTYRECLPMLFKGSVCKPFPTHDMAFEFAREGYSTFFLHPDPYDDEEALVERYVWLVKGEMMVNPQKPWEEKVPVYTIRENESNRDDMNLQTVCQGMPKPHNRHRACLWGIYLAICSVFVPPKGSPPPNDWDRMTVCIQDWKVYQSIVFNELHENGSLVTRVRKKLQEWSVTLQWIPDMQKDRREDLPEFDPKKFSQSMKKTDDSSNSSTSSSPHVAPRVDGEQSDSSGCVDGVGGEKTIGSKE